MGPSEEENALRRRYVAKTAGPSSGDTDEVGAGGNVAETDSAGSDLFDGRSDASDLTGASGTPSHSPFHSANFSKSRRPSTKSRCSSSGSVGSELEDSALFKGPRRLLESEYEAEWPEQKLGLAYEIASLVSNVAIDTFFSNVEVVNEENVPSDGPCILFATHANQFVDGMVLVRAAERPVSFVAAKVSYDKPVIGDLLKAFDAVPVSRPQDTARPGSGSLVEADFKSYTLKGKGSNFMTEVKPRELVGNSKIGQFLVEKVISDTELLFRPKTGQEEQGTKLFDPAEANVYKITPHVDQKEMFSKVTHALSQGRCIGIFPEGGSHDRTEMLPLKPGIAIMALEALAAGIPVKVCPVGINYFSGHVFRSNAFVDVGKQMRISDAMVELYRNPATKKLAVSQLLEEMRSALEMVTLQAPDYETLKVIRTARRIYQGKVSLSAKEYVELNIRFTSAYQKWKDDEEFSQLMLDIGEYLQHARALGLTDKEVRDLRPLGSLRTLLNSLNEVFNTFVLICIVTPLVFPGFVLNLPMVYYVRNKLPAEMEKARKASSVKLAARDVAASLQIMTALKMLPVLHVLYSLFWVAFFIVTWPHVDQGEYGSWGRMFKSQAWWLLPLAFFFLGPKYTFQFCPRMIEKVYRQSKLLPRYLLSIKSFFSSSHRGPAERLRTERKKLTVRIQDLVEQNIQTYPEWNNERIINRAKLLKKRSKSIMRLVKSGDLAPDLPANPSITSHFPSRPSFTNLNALGAGN